MVMIAVLVNPKDRRAYIVEVAGNTVFIEHRITRETMGQGTFEFNRSDTEIITGFPRVHTDAGVKLTDSGLGTMLYTGMCVAAAMHSQKKLELDVAVHGAGISSDDNRSPSAAKWWSAAKNKYGLAYEVNAKWPYPHRHRADAYSFDNALQQHLVAFTVLEDEVEAIDTIALQSINNEEGYGSEDRVLEAMKKL